jgi:hypothetical protein
MPNNDAFRNFLARTNKMHREQANKEFWDGLVRRTRSGWAPTQSGWARGTYGSGGRSSTPLPKWRIGIAALIVVLAVSAGIAIIATRTSDLRAGYDAPFGPVSPVSISVSG